MGFRSIPSSAFCAGYDTITNKNIAIIAYEAMGWTVDVSTSLNKTISKTTILKQWAFYWQI